MVVKEISGVPTGFSLEAGVVGRALFLSGVGWHWRGDNP